MEVFIEVYGIDFLYEKFKEIDSDSVVVIYKNNYCCVIWVFEVYEVIGKKFSDYIKE